jgi:hypothetical protein
LEGNLPSPALQCRRKLTSKTKLNIFLDDDRPLPEGFDLLFRSGRSLLKYLRENKGAEFGIISFDHDLGVVMDGYDVVKNAIEHGAFPASGFVDPVKKRAFAKIVMDSSYSAE